MHYWACSCHFRQL